MGGLDLGLGLRLNIWVNRDRNLVGFVDGRRLRLLLGKAVTLLQSLQFQTVYAIQNAVKLLLQPVVRAHVQ